MEVEERSKQKRRPGKELSEKRIGQIAWKIILDQGHVIPPKDSSLITDEELVEFGKAIIDAERGTNYCRKLTEERRNEIALTLIKYSGIRNGQKLDAEEVRKARLALARRIGVYTKTIDKFTAQIMSEK